MAGPGATGGRDKVNAAIESLSVQVGNLEQDLESLEERVNANRGLIDVLAKLPERVAELSGALETIKDLIASGFDGVHTAQQVTEERLTSPKYIIQFAGAVIVPLLIAILGGYFALKAGAK